MRVFPPDDYHRLSHILESWRKTAHSYGYQEYQTPLIDPVDLYTDKTSDEIVREQTYTFTDRGGRDVLLRPEITPGASAMIADLQEKRKVQTPLKTFSIGSVFRYERTQRGRSREHIQFNADIFGESDPWADAEVISVAFSALTAAGLSPGDIIVRINDRRALETTLTDLGVAEKDRSAVTRLLDRREKTEPEDFEKEMQRCTDVSPASIDKALTDEPKTVTTVRELLHADINAVYDPLIVRGFDYYTGIVFEFFAADQSIMQRSLVGGGRYDHLIESYGGSALPAVGFGMGDTVLLDCLEAYNTQSAQHAPFVALYTDSDTHIPEAKQTAELIRATIPTTFLGTVPKNKQSAMHKRHAGRGASFIVRHDSSGYTVRNVGAKTDRTVRTPHEVAAAVQAKQSIMTKLRSMIQG